MEVQPITLDAPTGDESLRRLAVNFELAAGRVGHTPMVPVVGSRPGPARLLMKVEGDNPTGSLKDRSCVALFRQMMRDPEWHPGQTVLDASSGSMGCSIAYFGRVLGVPVHIVSSSKLTVEKRFFIEHFGATLETTGTFTIEGNELCRRMAQADPHRWYFLDQLHNAANPQAHVETTGPEILAQAPDVTAVVGSIGTGGTLLGVARHLKRIRDGITIVAVESALGTRIPGTAALADGDYRTPFIEEGYATGLFDATISVSLAEAAHATHTLSGSGLFGGLQTGAVLAAAERAVDELGLRGDVVVLSGDTGWKNIDALSRAMADTAG